MQKFTVPQLKHNQIKNFLGVAPGGVVIFEHPLDRTLLKVAAFRCLGVEKEAMDPILEIVPEPLLVRNGETGFLTLENFARNMGAKSFFSYEFGCEAPDLEFGRQRGGKFKEFVIK